MDTLALTPYNSRLIALGTAALGFKAKQTVKSEMEFSFISLFYNLQPSKLTLAL